MNEQVSRQVSRLILVAGLVIIAAVLVMTRKVWLGVFGHGVPSVWRIAKMTVAEARRRRVLQAVVILVVLILGSLTFFTYLSPHEQARMIIDSGLTSIAAFGMLLAIFIGAFMIPQEIESRTIYPILAKPVRRFEFVLGKYVGALIILGVVVAIMTVVLVGVLVLQDSLVKDLPDSKFDPNLFNVVFAAVMSYFSLAVLTSLIILISSVSSTTMTIIGAVLLWVVGSMQSMLLDLSTKVTGATKLLTLIFFYAVPPLQNFDFRMEVSNFMQFSLGSAVFALERGLLYAIVALVVASIFFDNRQVEMRNRRPAYGLVALFALGMLFAQVPAQNAINARRPKVFDPNRRDPGRGIVSISGPTPVLIAALGGFRTVAADLLWLKVDQLWDGGAWYLLPSVMESVVQLDPHFLMAWQVYGWHLAYNLNAESVLEVDRRLYLDQGIQVLERAVATNPDSADMMHEFAWTLFDRAHNLDKAAEYFYRSAEMRGARSYSARLYYRCYEQSLNFKKFWPALKYAMGKFKDDHQHQAITHRDYDYWRRSWNDPMAHRRIIVEENTARQQRSIPYLLYPDDPFWNVCPLCGVPTKKGEPECSFCHHYRFKPEQVKPGDAAA